LTYYKIIDTNLSVCFEDSPMDQPSKEIQYAHYQSGRWETIESGVVVEQPVSLTVNGKIWVTWMCTPLDLEALAVGFLYNENVISHVGDIESIRVCPTHENVDVWLNRSVEEPTAWRRTSGCTGGVTSADPEDIQPVSKNGIVLSPQTVQTIIHKLFESQALYRQVGGVHTSALTDGSQILVIAEDIGRHNTLDKIAGSCLLKGVDPTGKVLLSTGRISSEMLQKAARMGVSVVISRTSPTSQSIQLARRMGITLIGYARRGSFNVYTHPQRIMTGTMPAGSEAEVDATIPVQDSDEHIAESEDAKE
jgi:FdhD protein